MTEAEWLTSDDPQELLTCARGHLSPLRFRWLTVEWGNRVRHVFEPDDQAWFDAYAAWVAGAGPHPSAVCQPPDFHALDRPTLILACARACAGAAHRDDHPLAAVCAGLAAAEDFPFPVSEPLDPSRSAERAEADAGRRAWWAARDEHGSRVRREFCDQFRDVAGNPFRPIVVDPDWLTPTVVAIAQGIYDDRAFDRLPVLADAIEDAGCNVVDLLTHCRGPGPHVRGCWPVDAILGKC